MFTRSVVSYEERGGFGRAGWPGNTSGRLIKDLIETVNPRVVVDPACGSNTTGDVVAAMRREGYQLEYHGRDLHQGFDLQSNPLAAEIGVPADLVFYHPPYWKMLRYSGNVWGTEPHPADLSHAETYDEFMYRLQLTLVNAFDCLKRGGRLAVLIGDLRKEGVYYPMQSHVASFAPGVVESIIIKQQHNCTSDRREYTSRIIRIEHESLIILRRDGVVFGPLDATLAISNRLKMFSTCTWRAIVEYALENLGGKATLDELYGYIEEHASERIKSPHWKEKIRQTATAFAVRLERGVYATQAFMGRMPRAA